MKNGILVLISPFLLHQHLGLDNCMTTLYTVYFPMLGHWENSLDKRQKNAQCHKCMTFLLEISRPLWFSIQNSLWNLPLPHFFHLLDILFSWNCFLDQNNSGSKILWKEFCRRIFFQHPLLERVQGGEKSVKGLCFSCWFQIFQHVFGDNQG